MLTRSTFARYETETTKLEEIVDQCTLQLICQIEYYFRNLTIIWQCCFVSWIIWIWAEPKNHWSCWSRSLNQITMQVKSWHIVMCFVRFTLKCPILPPEMADLCINVQSVLYTVNYPNPDFDISGHFRLNGLDMYCILFQHMVTGLRAS